MNAQQAGQPRVSANGYVRRRMDRETGAKTESKMHSGKPAFSNVVNSVNGGKTGGIGGPSRDRLIYSTSRLLDQRVEVHVKNGSIISGILHGTNEKDFGVLLLMAQVIKDGSVRVPTSVPDSVKKPQTMIIPGKDLVQVLAKDVSLPNDEITNAQALEKRKDLMVDSAISHSHHLEVERELERWTPDIDDPECPELENIFDGSWSRNWNQFETNETLFGVKSTFDEELYTTKLERGPHMRGIEREALRIAREIEGEETHDRHLAEERGVMFNEDFDHDEEIRYSAVQREVDDHRFENMDSSFSDACNSETFGESFAPVVPGSDISRKKVRDEGQPSPTCSSVDGEASNEIQADKDLHLSGSTDYVGQLTSGHVLKSLSINDENRLDGNQRKIQGDKKNLFDESTEKVSEGTRSSNSMVSEPAVNLKGLSPSATAYDPCGYENKNSCSRSSESVGSVKISSANEPVNPSLRPHSSTASPSESACAASASSAPGLSPSSSVGSLSSEKSTLNPYAKEFRLNPNAKSFTPSTSLRTHTPISEGSFYYASNIPAVPNVNNLPAGVGFGPTFSGHQPVYNPQGAQLQSPQAYIPPNAPLYGQHMILGQARPVFYMPAYQPEMQYKGRNF